MKKMISVLLFALLALASANIAAAAVHGQVAAGAVIVEQTEPASPHILYFKANDYRMTCDREVKVKFIVQNHCDEEMEGLAYKITIDGEEIVENNLGDLGAGEKKTVKNLEVELPHNLVGKYYMTLAIYNDSGEEMASRDYKVSLGRCRYY